MANSTTGMFEEHVLPALAQVQTPATYRNSMLKKVWMQQTLIAGRIGRTIDVNIPTVNEGDVIDIGSGAVQITDETHTNVQLTVNNNKSVSRRISDFDQLRTSGISLYDYYIGPMLEALLRKIDRQVCNLVNTTNFNVHSSITGGADTFTRANLGTAWSNLMSVGVPADPNNLFFVTSNLPYANMISDTSFIQESIVGVAAAEAAQQTARLMPAYQAMIDFDQLFPQPTAGSTYAGLFFHRWSIAWVPVTIPLSNSNVVAETYYSLPGTPVQFRTQLWYDPREQGWILHIHCVFALAVVRPNFGSYLVST